MDCDHERILASFGSRKTTERHRAIADACRDPHADGLLAHTLGMSKDMVYEKVVIAAHLGDLNGEAGDAALRRVLGVSGPGSRDLRCAAVLALAKRCGEQATPQLLTALGPRDGAVKDYAIIGLAGAGGDRGWDEAFKRLPALLRRQRRSAGQSEVTMALAYLAQQLQNPDRRRRLVAFVRKHWVILVEDEWFANLWPEARPDGPAAGAVPAPDAASIRAWARHPLFQPLGLPLTFG